MILAFSGQGKPPISMMDPSNDFFSDDAASDSSDAPSTDGDYRPILTIEESDGEEDAGDIHSNGSDLIHHSNPSFRHRHLENGISALDMNGNLERGGGGEEEEEENEVAEREREASISRAFREDESRRNAPLPPDNAVRVMEAMRGVSFRGFPPDWAGRVPEDRWVDHIRRLRSGGPTTQT